MQLKFLITAGPTREYIDPVRYISNASSGKMGYALANSARKKGHKVVLISGPVAIKPPAGVRTVRVTSAREMFARFKEYFPTADVIIGASAVSDFRPQEMVKNKIKKVSRTISLKLVPNPDIMEYAGKRKKRKVLVGFALETHDLFKFAKEKLERKNFDVIVANYPEVIGSNKASVWIIDKDSNIVSIPKDEKNKVAKRIIDEALETWKSNNPRKKLPR